MYNQSGNYVPEINLAFDPYEFVCKYEVFFNAGFEDLMALAVENERDGIWTINILTCEPDEVDDFSGMDEVWHQIPHCLKPLYAGNLDEQSIRKAVDMLVMRISMGGPTEEIGYYDEDI